MGNHKKLLQFLRPDPASVAPAAKSRSPSTSTSSDSDDDGGGGGYDDDTYSPPTSSPSTSASAVTSAAPSPYRMSPWTQLPGLGVSGFGAGIADEAATKQQTGLLGSLVKEDGHVYSLAAAGDLLYTGTDSRNVRVWRDRREMGGFKSGSGLVKAIVVAADGRIFTGHQDGKVRVWRRRHNQDSEAEAEAAVVEHRRVGTLPRLRDVMASSLLPSRYVRTRRRRSQLWLRHFDAVSCLSLDAAAGLLYSGSWDKTVKVWRVSDSRCLESVPAHDDAVNAVAAAGFDALLFTGSADGTVKVWRREQVDNKNGRRRTKHSMERVLRAGDGAVTAIAVAAEARVVYVGSSDGAVTHWQFRRGGVGNSAAANALPPRNGGALRGHKMAVLCLAVAAGRVVVSGSADRTICVWRREEGAEHSRLAVLTGHAGPVKCVAMDEEEEDGAGGDGGARRWVVYSGSLDGSVKVWRVSDGGSGAPGLMMTPARTPPPARAWKGAAAPPSPLSAWTPYAAAPETKRMAAA